MWVGLMFMGMSLLFWVGVTAFIVWALMRWVAPRLRNSPLMTSNIMQPQQPSAVETLRHRYAVGEIDAPTFELMVERILASEERERQGQQPIASRDAEIYNT